jgi:hypothetical protein
VILAFATESLRTICGCQQEAEAKYGFAVARELRARLTDLREVDCILELPVGQPEFNLGASAGCCRINLTDGFRLVIRANHLQSAKSETGEIAWSEVRRVMITEIEDTNV